LKPFFKWWETINEVPTARAGGISNHRKNLSPPRYAAGLLEFASMVHALVFAAVALYALVGALTA
jgi:hypothetical protein